MVLWVGENTRKNKIDILDLFRIINMNSNQIVSGNISSGPAFSGSKCYPVKVSLYWKSGMYQNLPRAYYVTPQNTIIYYRHTHRNGWREYDITSKTFYSDGNSQVTFIPNTR